MYLIKALIDIVIILLLLRLLIRKNEATFNQIYRLLYRITDPLLAPLKIISRDDTRRILISVLCLVVLRGLVFISIKPMSFLTGTGYSLLILFQLLFQFYMVVWFISVLSEYSYGSSLLGILQRAFIPIHTISRKMGISTRYFNIFAFLFLWILYSLLSFLIHLFMRSGGVFSSFSFIQGLGEGLILTLGLFPGFFSLVIIVGALLSWVSPDPYNPIVQAIYGISEPFLAPFRRIVPNLGGLDISPIIALLCFQILGRFGQQLISGIVRIL